MNVATLSLQQEAHERETRKLLHPGAGYFRYHGPWAPGVYFFRTLKFGAKAAWISLAFLLPLAVLAWSFFSNIAEQREFSAKEIDGSGLIRKIHPLLEAVQLQRQALRAGEQHGVDVQMLNTLASNADGDVAGDPLGAGLGAAWKAVDTAHRALVSAAAQGNPADAQFEDEVAALNNMISSIADVSNLTLDPDVDTYYLMSVVTGVIPTIESDVARLRARSAALPRDATMSPTQAQDLYATLVDAQTQAQAAWDQIGKVRDYNAEAGNRVDSRAAAAALQLFFMGARSALHGDHPCALDAGTLANGRQALDELKTLRHAAQLEMDRLLRARVARLEAKRNLTAGLVAFSLVLAAYLFVAFAKVLNGGVRELSFHLDKMAEGDLTTLAHAWGQDEIADVMHSVAGMQMYMRHIVRDVRSASEAIAQATDEVAAGAMDLSRRTEQMAANLQQTAASMEEIAATVTHTSQSASQAAELALENAAVSEQGGQVIGQVVHTMQDIRDSSGKISEIIGVIDGIAFQTNILALNAAVEAARAGEQGRGFSVVAQEVRALAQRCALAASEIKQLISGSVERVRGGAEVVASAGGTMQRIEANAAHMRQLLQEIAQGTKEQTAGVTQVGQAVQELDRVTQQNAALVEESAAAASALKEQAKVLAQDVSQFKVPAKD